MLCWILSQIQAITARRKGGSWSWLVGSDWWFVEYITITDVNRGKTWKGSYHIWFSYGKYKVHVNCGPLYEIVTAGHKIESEVESLIIWGCILNELGHGESLDRKRGWIVLFCRQQNGPVKKEGLMKILRGEWTHRKPSRSLDPPWPSSLRIISCQ